MHSTGLRCALVRLSYLQETLYCINSILFLKEPLLQHFGKVTDPEDPLSWKICSAREVKPDWLTVNVMTFHIITAIILHRLQELCVKVSIPMHIHTCRNTFMHACTHPLYIHMHNVRVLK